MSIPGWPAIVDDDGTLTVGTKLTASVFSDMEDAVEALCVDPATPLISPADIIAEVVAARGSEADLDTRISVEHNADGTHKASGSIVYQVQAAESLFRNFCTDPMLYNWPDGDAAAPYQWTLTGAGAAIARCGDGLGDTQKMSWGKFCAKLTYGAGVLKLTKTILDATRFQQLYGLRGKVVTVACRCKSSIANHASIIMDDGIVQTRGGLTGNGTYHSGGGTEEWIYASIALANTATKLDVIFDVAQAGSAYFGDVMVILGPIIPTTFIPARVGNFIIGLQQRGTLATKVIVNEMQVPIPLRSGAILQETKIKLGTTSAGGDVIYDVNKNGAANSAYTTKPHVDAAATYGDGVPDGTYANRCFKEEDLVSVDCDGVGGAGTEGQEANIVLRFSTHVDEWDSLYG